MTAVRTQPLVACPGKSSEIPKREIHTVALIGPPNSGKSTLFNRLTRLRQKVGNYPGITVEQRVGLLTAGGPEIKLIDLPGVYSLTPYSEDERVAVDVLTGKMDGLPRPDAILLVLDVTNLSRQLVLAAPVIALGLPILVLLNMADVFTKGGGSLDVLKLAAELGAPVAMVSATQGSGSDAVERFLRRSSRSAARRRCFPILQDLPQCRKWANQLSHRVDYQRPLPSVWTRRLDDILTQALGAAHFCDCRGCRFPDCVWTRPAHEHSVSGPAHQAWGSKRHLSFRIVLAAPVTSARWPVEGREFGAGFLPRSFCYSCL